MRLTRIIAASFVGVLSWMATPSATAQQPGDFRGTAKSAQVTILTDAQRTKIANQLSSKFAGAVLKTPGGDVKAWSKKLRGAVATADASNVLRATTMPSLDLMHAALAGANIDQASIPAAGSNSLSAPQVLGSNVADTTYTPLPNGRCRVADSRVISSPLSANTNLGIDTEDVFSYADQGGNGTFANGDGSANCGIPSFATAVAISVTILNASAEGYFKVFSGSAPFQTGNTVVYKPGVFSGSADLIVTSCQTCLDELTIRSISQVNYVIDVLGYFMPAEATPLQCVETARTSVTVAANGGQTNVTAPTCAAGYTMVSTNCESTSWLMPFVYQAGGNCSAKNNGGSDATLRASAVCCQVPGR